MDTNLIIALVGACSALLGTLIGGVLSTWSQSKQIKAENMRCQYKEKRDAYVALLAGYHIYINQASRFRKSAIRDINEELSAFYQFSSACAMVILLAPPDIEPEIRSFTNLVSRFAEGSVDAQELGETYLTVQRLLRRDLGKMGYN